MLPAGGLGDRRPGGGRLLLTAGPCDGKVAAWTSTRWPTSSTRCRPTEFIALRKERQDAAKADGDKALAKEIGALPKPSAAAWVANVLVREHREEIENLVELGTLLREAQENLAGDQLAPSTSSGGSWSPPSAGRPGRSPPTAATP